MPDGSQLTPYVDPKDTEGAALQLLRLVDRESMLLNHPAAVFFAFGVDARSGKVPGLAACLDFARRMARVARAAEFLRWWSLAHELGHFAATVMGWPRPHDERAIDDLAARIWIRRGAVLRAVGTVGWNPVALASYFGEVPASVVFQRVAVEACGYAIGRDGMGRRFAYGPEGRWVPPTPTSWERRHLRIALAGASEPFLLGTERGGEVASFDDDATGRRGAVILFPEEPEYLRR
jgi:hypothetical protein